MQKRNTKKMTVPTVETTQVTVPTLHGIKQVVVPAAAGAAAAAKHWGDEQAHAAGDWAKPRLEHGRENAHVLAEALAERSEEARGKIESSTPKLTGAVSGLLASSAATRGEAGGRAADALKVLKGEATIKPVKKKGKKRGVLINFLATIGVLTAAGAIAAYLSKKQGQPKDDPWARPLTDPYVADKSSGVGAAAGTTTVGSDAGASGFTVGASPDRSVDQATDPAAGDVPVADLGATPPAHLEETEIVDLTADGLPPEGDVEARDTTTTTLGDAVDNDKGRN